MGRDFLNVGWDGTKNRMGWDGFGMNPGRKFDFSFGTVPFNISSGQSCWPNNALMILLHIVLFILSLHTKLNDIFFIVTVR